MVNENLRPVTRELRIGLDGAAGTEDFPVVDAAYLRGLLMNQPLERASFVARAPVEQRFRYMLRSSGLEGQK
ncbi:hypothetical protein A2631_05575 [Candidatus Daviesbacteria bacterium RIFCSPHIGHO2_01_FULL_44_29]|uniref:Uncharacterized protein n=1 Tax=Candidatus Daviesbacteria bacterium RIFCSPHIGHO2_02_FULL_43_12 TaxID=1797776 RepID=A0A1F5KI44_9BACT|nr:MAG: hypothetical protein A2631_05575 [Candidatus Daviesbacteria bacterium RIFCSPHIGHO2_01_FULL_44_29]OGE39215.1 MAG: hypothetical protein A3E86_01320 [Candidatus Daviesbacteria bacterium RIFCSPHIGHO2_12_FULL_47_45]OGE40582.1 MAG: hypothetical protein A3D25_00490 [Candidatus Daviesbacteria bacterium RIFCSPHIGHO2_02_FULL_43_12]OGE70142.1 MAG: hypothetical protein A3B55_00260 [Candidatus Daviesbacteria bacterium RIFCSPLOWO2_01_FULL_43_15]